MFSFLLTLFLLLDLRPTLSPFPSHSDLSIQRHFVCIESIVLRRSPDLSPVENDHHDKSKTAPSTSFARSVEQGALYLLLIPSNMVHLRLSLQIFRVFVARAATRLKKRRRMVSLVNGLLFCPCESSLSQYDHKTVAAGPNLQFLLIKLKISRHRRG